MRYKWILFFIFGMALAGCGRKEAAPQEPPTQAVDSVQDSQSEIEEYFPKKANTLYEYQGIGSDVAGQQIFNTYINGNTVQRYLLSGGGHRLIEVLSLEEGQLALVFGDIYSYYPEDLTGNDYEAQTVLLKEPLEVGNRWERDQYGGVSEITDMAATVETPYGTFEAIEVSTLVDVNGTTFAEQSYYAKDVGLVKMVYGKDDGDTLGSELKSVQAETRLSLPYFYFNPIVTETDYEIIPEIREMEIGTNERLEEILEKQFRGAEEPGDELTPLISGNTSINSIEPDRAGNRMKVDFSKEFISEMNAGAGMEQNILQGVVNTLGNLYRVGEIYLTVEGRPYESGHIVMNEDEYMKVETKEMEE